MNDTSQRKQLAKQLQSNALLWESLSELETDITEGWKLERDPALRDAKWHLVRALLEIREKLETTIDAAVRNDGGDTQQ